MLTMIEVRTSQGTLLSLPLEDSTGGFEVQNIEGLEPVKATLVSSGFALLDGAQYHSSRRETRNIKLTLGFDPDYILGQTVESLRKTLYGFFMPKTQPSLRFHMDDGTYVDILGRVEDFGAPLFSQDPAVDISLVCFDPDFYDPNPVLLSGLSTALEVETTVNYQGTVETGIEFTLLPARSLSAFTIYNRHGDNTLQILEFSMPLVAGDTLSIKTIPGDKEATLTRANVLSSVLYSISPQSNWIEFQPGENRIRIYAEGAAIPYEIEYTTKYGGL